MPSITIKQWPERIEAGRRADTILNSVMKAGVPLPNQCRTGECGSCRCKLLQGHVKHDSYLPEALSPELEAAGWILPCRCYALDDIELDCPGSWEVYLPRAKCWLAKVKSIKAVTDNIVHLQLQSQHQPFRFLAGQYFDLAIKGKPRRSYSPANEPSQSVLDFYIRVYDGGQVSAYVAESLNRGDTLQVHGPYGDAYLQPDLQTPLLGVATGTGLAPLLSIAYRYQQQYLHEQTQRPMRLLIQAHNQQAVFAEKILREIAVVNPDFSYRWVYRPNNVPDRDQEPLLQALSEELPQADQLRHWQIHLAGSPSAVKYSRDLLLAKGAKPGSIHLDAFTASVDKPTSSFMGQMRHVFSQWLS